MQTRVDARFLMYSFFAFFDAASLPYFDLRLRFVFLDTSAILIDRKYTLLFEWTTTHCPIVAWNERCDYKIRAALFADTVRKFIYAELT